MYWELTDQITHETVTFRGRGEWRIGREFDPEETSKFFSFYQSSEGGGAGQRKVLVPITADYEKCKKILGSFVLSKVSREHAVFGIDERGPYLVDISTNGTTIRDEQGYKQCGKGMKCRLRDGIIIQLATNYPLLLRKRNQFEDILANLKDLLRNAFRISRDAGKDLED